jgi:hypothetical protein
MEHDSSSLLFQLVQEYLISARVIRPGVVRLAKKIATARAAAGELTFEKVAHLLTVQRTGELDTLLRFDAGLGMTRLAWLTKPAVQASATAIKSEIDKLAFLRGIDAHTLDLSMLRPSGAGSWPRSDAARPTRRWNGGWRSGAIRSC